MQSESVCNFATAHFAVIAFYFQEEKAYEKTCQLNTF